MLRAFQMVFNLFFGSEYAGIDRKKSINPRIRMSSYKKVNLFLDIALKKW